MRHGGSSLESGFRPSATGALDSICGTMSHNEPDAVNPAMSDRSRIVLDAVLRVMRPLARLLLRQGVTYPAFSTALKRVFLDAALDELGERGTRPTDSAVTLLSGVHRRDVRTLLRAEALPPQRRDPPLNLAAEVVARWLHDARFHDAQGAPRTLARGPGPESFDQLVAEVSRDVRARAMLDDMLRQGVVSESDDGVTLSAEGYAPRQGLDDMAQLFAANLADHIAAAAANLQGQRNLLEQAVFVDEITPASAEQLQRVAVQAWKQAFQQVMGEAQTRFDTDATEAEPAQRTHRARFGVYFYSDRDEPHP